MLGAIIGDITGSCYEFSNIKTTDFPLISNSADRVSWFTDDTVCTVAVAEALLTRQGEEIEFAKCLRLWGNGYPHAGYGTLFNDWLRDPAAGPYNSWG